MRHFSSQDWIRSSLYNLWSSIRGGTDDSISPVGLSSDNYAGLIFWDAETWMYPSLLLMHPDIADSVAISLVCDDCFHAHAIDL